MNEVPIIGQKPKQPPLMNVEVGVDGNQVVLSLVVMGGVMRSTAPMDVNVAGQVMANLGTAIEQLEPGTLIPALENWLAQIKDLKAKGRKVMQELKSS